MVGTSNNLYISIARPKPNDAVSTYRKPQHTWLLSVEPHSSHVPEHVPGLPHKAHDPVHYAAIRDEDSGLYTIDTHSDISGPVLIGNVLIAESAHASAERIHQILTKAFTPSTTATSSKHLPDDQPEQWIGTAIRRLQEHKLCEPFGVDEFMAFTHGYEANRMDNEAPAMIAYPKAHRNHEEKSSKHKFWLLQPATTHPNSAATHA